jgi:hypothetical protein
MRRCVAGAAPNAKTNNAVIALMACTTLNGANIPCEISPADAPATANARESFARQQIRPCVTATLTIKASQPASPRP